MGTARRIDVLKTSMSLAMIGRGSGPVVLARWWDALIAAKTSLGRLIARRQELECVGGRREGLARAFVTSCGPGRLGGRGRVRGLGSGRGGARRWGRET